MADINFEPVVSSNISAIGFDALSSTMYVKFSSGQTYEASGATQADYDDFKMAKSKGSHFAKILKQSFAWKKIEKKS